MMHAFDKFAKDNFGKDRFPGDGIGFVDNR